MGPAPAGGILGLFILMAEDNMSTDSNRLFCCVDTKTDKKRPYEMSIKHDKREIKHMHICTNPHSEHSNQ